VMQLYIPGTLNYYNIPHILLTNRMIAQLQNTHTLSRMHTHYTINRNK